MMNPSSFLQKKERPSISRSLFWLLVVSFLLPGVLHADWKLRRGDRWSKIAKRLERMVLKRPTDGYALRRLLRHYRGRGGASALRRRLSSLRLTHAQKGRLQLAIALVDLNSGRYNSAITALRKAAQTPSLAGVKRKILLSLGKAYLRTSQWEKAQNTLNEAMKGLSKRKGRVAVLRVLSQLSEKMHQWKRALRYYRALIALRPKEVNLRLSLIRVLDQAGQSEAASKELSALLPRVPKHRRAELYKRLARVHLQHKKTKESLEAIGQARRLINARHWLHRPLLALEMQAHRIQKTLPTLLTQYLTRARSRPKRYLPRAAALQVELGQPQKALKTYRTLLRRYPKHPSFFRMIDLLEQQGLQKEALGLLNKRRKQRPREFEIPLRIIKLHQKSGRTDLRDQEIRRFLKDYRNNRLFLARLSTLLKKWKASEALQLASFAQLCQKKPPRAECFVRWGKYLWSRRKRTQALRTWEKILAIKPLQGADRFLLAQTYRDHGYSQRSVPLLQQVLKRTPKHHRARLMLAYLFQNKRQPQRAIKHFHFLLKESKHAGLRQKAQSGIVRATLRSYGYISALMMFQRDYYIKPFHQLPRKLLLHFYLHNRQKRKAGKLLEDSLSLFPDDHELHRLALEHYRDRSQMLVHLRWILLQTHAPTATALQNYVRQSKRFAKTRELLPFLQQLSRRWARVPHVWGTLAREATLQSKWAEAQEAFTQARKLAPKQAIYRLGMAQLLANQQRWQQALTLLLEPPFPKKQKLREAWVELTLLVGIKAKEAPADVWKRLSAVFPEPSMAMLRIFEGLQERKWSLSPKARKAFRAFLMQQGGPLWRRVALTHRSAKRRLDAIYVLWNQDKQGATSLLFQALQDRAPSIRANACVLFALLGKKENYLYLERIERTDRHYMVRIAASIGASYLAGEVETRQYYRALRWWPMRRAMRTLIQARPKPKHLLWLARMYRSHHRDRPKILALLPHLAPNTLSSLRRMLTHSYRKCFGYHGLRYLQSKAHHNDTLRLRAARISLPHKRLRKRCPLTKRGYRRYHRRRRYRRRRRRRVYYHRRYPYRRRPYRRRP